MFRSIVVLPFTLLLFCGLATLKSLAAQPAQAYELLDQIEKKKDKNLLYEVRQHIQLANGKRAIEGLNTLLTTYPNNVDLVYMRGAIHQEMKQFSAAAADFERGVALAPDYKVGAIYELGKLYHRIGNFEQAQRKYEQFLSRVGPNDPAYKAANEALKNARFAVQLMANPVPFDPQPLAGGVNTEPHHEYFPVVSIDGKRLIFTRNVHRNGEDFYESYRQDDGTWSVAEPLERMNSDYEDAAHTMSANGRLIVFTICGKKDAIGGCDLYFTEKKNGTWTPVRNMGPSINSPAWDSQPTLSADGKLLFFTSTRKGGLGGSDLWGSARNGKGVWSPAVNLGRTLNTPGKDEFPFLHPDGRSLYFTSNGHPGMGGMDLFFVRLGADNRWSTPENLGYPINTPNEETSLFIGLDGKEAFFAKSINADDPDATIDLYSFELPEKIRPLPTTYVQATVTDALTGEPLQAEVFFRATDDNRPIQPQQTDEKGQFLLVLPGDHNYALSVDQAGYLPHSRQFTLESGATLDDPFLINIELQPINQTTLPTTPIVLRNVLFASGSAELLEFSYDELDRLARMLNNRASLRIEIAGHTDNVGSEADNLALSEERAKAVFTYLTQTAGVAAQQVTYVGYGESRPIADNDTDAGRSENRRTEFRVRESTE